MWVLIISVPPALAFAPHPWTATLAGWTIGAAAFVAGCWQQRRLTAEARITWLDEAEDYALGRISRLTADAADAADAAGAQSR